MTGPAATRQPYRLLFPLGVLLSWAGVGHWLLHATGSLDDYRSIYHAIVQVQGFLTCLAVGFLFTAIPVRTGTAPASGGQLVVVLVAPVVVTMAAWFERWALSQIAWLAIAATLLHFLLPRLLGPAKRRPPTSFVWVPGALAMGIAGSVMTGTRGVMGDEWRWVHDVGRGLLLQGMFLGLVLGVGGLVIPLMTRGEGPPDMTASRRDRAVAAAHIVGIVLVTASFFVEVLSSARAGFAMRFVVALATLLGTARIHQRPARPGWNRWAIWLAAWLVPTGYGLAAAFPETRKAGLHVVFIGGYAMLALTVGAHVMLSHADTDQTELRDGRPWQVPVLVGLLLGAAVLRGLVDWRPAHFFLWLGAASVAFLLATVVWITFVAPARSGPQTS